MQKQSFSSFVNSYKQWKMTEKKSSVVTPAEVRKIRELYESMNSKKPENTNRIKESASNKDSEFEDTLSKYREWKFKKAGTRGVTFHEKILIREGLAKRLSMKKLKEDEFDDAFKDETDKCECCGNDKHEVSTVDFYVDEHKDDLGDISADEIIDSLNNLNGISLDHDSLVCEDCIKDGIFNLNDDTDLKFDESVDAFKKVVAKFREWKKSVYHTARLTESEKTVLKEKFLDRVAKAKKAAKNTKASKFDEAIAQYKEWKLAKHGTDEVTKIEEATIKQNIIIDDIKAKLDEAKKFIESGKKHLTEGDVMDAGADANAAAGAVNDAAALGNDQALAGDQNVDPNVAPVAGTPLPQNIVDEISQIKSSIDALATECGIESPVSLDANVDAGVPPVTGAANETPAEAAPAPAPAPEAAPQQAPLPESIKSVKQRIAERNKALKEAAKFSNTAFKDGVDLAKIPSESELVNGTKTGIAKAAEWPIKDVKPADAKKVKNIEESTDPENLAKICLNEDNEFSWKKYTEMLKNI